MRAQTILASLLLWSSCGPFGAIAGVIAVQDPPGPGGPERDPEPAAPPPGTTLQPLLVLDVHAHAPPDGSGFQMDYRGPVVAEPIDGGYRVEALGDGFFPDGAVRIVSGRLDAPGTAEVRRGNAPLFIDVARVHPHPAIPKELADAWSYTASLLGDEPVYDPLPDVGPLARNTDQPDWTRLDGLVPAERRRLLLEAIANRSVSYSDEHWEQELSRAIGARDDGLALRIFRYYRPVGHCSMDNGPALQAMRYAGFCKERGRTSCFLQLHLRVMGDRFERSAWSTYGEAAHQTAAGELSNLGIDVDRYLLGLAVTGSGRTRLGGIGPQRLARAIREAGREATIAPVLERWAQDPAVDELNRVRAMSLLVLLPATIDAAHLEAIAALALSDASRSIVHDWQAELARRDQPAPATPTR